MKTILAIDPGPTQSAYVVWNGEKLGPIAITESTTLLTEARNAFYCLRSTTNFEVAVIEGLQCFGMAVGKEVFETAYFIGRLMERCEAHNIPCVMVYRSQVKMHHCLNMHAKDSNIRQALIDKYGAPGTRKAPGRTYGLARDLWSAFAIATYYLEKNPL